MTMRRHAMLLLCVWWCVCCGWCAADPTIERTLALDAEVDLDEDVGDPAAFTLETAQEEAARLLQSCDQDGDLFLVPDDTLMDREAHAALGASPGGEGSAAIIAEAELINEHQDGGVLPMRNEEESANWQSGATLKRIKVQLPLKKKVPMVTMDSEDAISASEAAGVDECSPEAEEDGHMRRSTFNEVGIFDDASVNAERVEDERSAAPTLRVRGVIFAEKRTDLRLMVESKFASTHEGIDRPADEQDGEEMVVDREDVTTFEAPMDSTNGGEHEPQVEVISEFVDGIGFDVSEDEQDIPKVEVTSEFVDGYESDLSENTGALLIGEEDLVAEENGMKPEMHVISNPEDGEPSALLASERDADHHETEVIKMEDTQPSVTACHSVLATAAEQLVAAFGNGHRPPAPDALKKCGAAVLSKVIEGVRAVVDPVEKMLQIVGYYATMGRSEITTMLRALHQTLEALCVYTQEVLALWSTHIASACREMAKWCCYIWTTYAEVRIACHNALSLALLVLAGMLFCSVYRAIAAVPDVLFTSFLTFDEVMRAQLKIFMVVLVLVVIYHARMLAWFWILVSAALGYYYWSGHVVISIKFK
ncbi:hypothetical protein FI667_g4680, partial [Globisporangium splendens]